MATYDELPTGGSLAAGTTPFGVVTSRTPSGGLRCGGTSDYPRFRTSGSGGMSLAGSFTAGVTSLHASGSGGPTLGGQSDFNTSFRLNLSFKWRKQSFLSKEWSFLWSTGRLRIFWYRIIGKGIPGNECGPLQGDECCQKFVMNVHARTLAELCEKLSRRKYKFPIDLVQKFSRPAENEAVAEDEAAGINHDCNVLTEVEVCHIPQCAEFCVTNELRQTVSFGMTVQIDSFLSQTASGSIFVGGTAPASSVRFLPAFSAEGSGGPALGGQASIGTDSYVGTGGLSVGGGSADTESSRYFYVGGVWPETAGASSPDSSVTTPFDPSDRPWLLPERAEADDGLYTQSDISFGRTSDYLIVRGFGVNVPAWATVTGVRVVVRRLATQTGVRDAGVYLVRGDEFISDNLAVTGTDWPLIETARTYGSAGADDVNLWRDPLGPDYLGQFTTEELNDPDFGVAVRVRGSTSLPATIAKIDHVGVEVFYEQANASRLRTGGEASFVSTGQSYAASGWLYAAGTSGTKVSGRFAPSGDGLEVGGGAAFAFVETPQGGTTLGGVARVGPDWESGTGGASCGGSALVKPYHEPMSGGSSAGGSVESTVRMSQAGSGGSKAGGYAGTAESMLSAVATGGVTVNSSASTRSSHHDWVSDGNAIFVLGSAGLLSSDLGTLAMDMSFGMSILETTATFLSDVHVGDAEPLTGSVSVCECFDIPLTLTLTQNLARDNVLAKFLVRNSLTMSRTITLRHSTVSDSWQANLHFRGFSPDSNTTETWDMVFDLQCTNVMGGIVVGRDVWKFGTRMKRKNLTTREDFETTIVVGILPELICGPKSNELDFSVTYDTQSGEAFSSPNATVYQNNLFDNIGIFKNRSWIDSPNLVMRLSQNGVTRPVTRVSLQDEVFV